MRQNALKSMFKMILYELKIVTSDAYQCKTWLTLLFLRWGNNCQKTKEKNIFVAHFHKAVRSRPMMLFDLHPDFCSKWQMKVLKPLHNSDKFVEDSTFSSQFRDLQKLV